MSPTTDYADTKPLLIIVMVSGKLGGDNGDNGDDVVVVVPTPVVNSHRSCAHAAGPSIMVRKPLVHLGQS